MDSSVGLVRWFDNKPVNLGSNFISSINPEMTSRYDKKEKNRLDVEVPEIVKIYNANMGGVDKFNQCISYYRIFMKSKKWTLRMMANGIDSAVVNFWLEYCRDCKTINLPKSKIMDLLNFRNSIAADLVSVGKTIQSNKKRGRLSQDSLSEDITDEPPKKNRSCEVRPPKNCRLDTVDQLPEFDEKKQASRCKAENCKGKTHIFCVKCKVHLCFVKPRNCFLKFHTT